MGWAACWELSPRTATGCGTQQPLRYRLRLAGRGPNGNSLFPPLAAVVAVAGLQSRPNACAPGPHPQDIRWRNSQPTALGFRELYQVLL